MARVAVIGQVVFDEIVLTPDARAEGVRSHVGYRLGGKAFNISIALARMGLDPWIISAVGSDTVGDKAREVLDTRNVKTENMKTCSTSFGGSVPTPHVRLMAGASGVERRVAIGEDTQMDRCYASALKDTARQGWDAIVFTLEMVDPLLPEIASLIAGARQENPNCLVVALASGYREDPPSPAIFDLLRGADVLTMNRREAAYVLRSDVVPALSAQVPLALNKRCQVRASCVTFGKDGWAWMSDADSGTQTLEEVPVVDAIGANDVFTATLVAELAGGKTLGPASLGAAHAARLSVERTGGTERFPTRAELDSAMSHFA